jgi:hypothetical protein
MAFSFTSVSMLRHTCQAVGKICLCMHSVSIGNRESGIGNFDTIAGIFLSTGFAQPSCILAHNISHLHRSISTITPTWCASLAPRSFCWSLAPLWPSVSPVLHLIRALHAQRSMIQVCLHIAYKKGLSLCWRAFHSNTLLSSL